MSECEEGASGLRQVLEVVVLVLTGIAAAMTLVVVVLGRGRTVGRGRGVSEEDEVNPGGSWDCRQSTDSGVLSGALETGRGIQPAKHTRDAVRMTSAVPSYRLSALGLHNLGAELCRSCLKSCGFCFVG